MLDPLSPTWGIGKAEIRTRSSYVGYNIYPTIPMYMMSVHTYRIRWRERETETETDMEVRVCRWILKLEGRQPGNMSSLPT
jgi:hypothetical protein